MWNSEKRWWRRCGVDVYEFCWCPQFMFYRRNMDRCIYHNILKKNVLSNAEKLSFGTTFTFHQDKHPKHTSKIFQEWCLYHVKQQLYDPPQSPDLIPIEHVWEEISRELKKYDT
ncbi:hypothetical protein AVEN_116024-1 [Araneus ventricosus]|uniref:Tc1-like transposase DDE domain-containing protein n=1 Tax=Araneus ventricosus TaxID=182803 RepID=A0A4Y2WHK4_ARAVE|nr:hypothetical protein AVEN_94048-1 [Araneus ventricosus]GBO36977.1 hypothetical protein AVEN_116024-1 [Araneus ventricosus]